MSTCWVVSRWDGAEHLGAAGRDGAFCELRFRRQDAAEEVASCLTEETGCRWAAKLVTDD